MDDPVHTKLEEIHKDVREIKRDVRGGFQASHDRMDRENEERAYGWARVVEMWLDLRATVKALFRKTPQDKPPEDPGPGAAP